MAGRRVARGSRSGRRFLVVLAVAAVLTAVVGWSAVTLLDEFGDDAGIAASPSADGSESPDADPSEDATPADEPSAGAEEDVAAQVEQCASEVERAAAVVEAARPGVQSWQEHTQARTDLLAKRITENRLEAIYAETTERGTEDVRRFEEVAEGGGGELPCEELKAATDDPAAADCLDRSEAAAEAVAASEAVIGDWSEHLHHMEQYDDGGMTTGTALKLWIKAWRSAPEGIRAFDEANSALDQAPACEASGA